MPTLGWTPWLLIALGACSGSNPAVTPAPDPVPVPDPDPPPPAAVLSFTSSTDSMIPGAAVVLSWEVRDAETVTLDPFGPVAGNVIQLSPIVTTTYTLRVSSAAGSDSANLTVVVDAPTSVPADVATVTTFSLAGGGVLLAWTPVATASRYQIDRFSGFGGPLMQTAEQPLLTIAGDRYWATDMSATPGSAPTYRVRATNSLGSSAGRSLWAISPLAPPTGPVGPIVTALDGTTAAPGGTLRFTATTSVTWALPQGPGSGAITSDGVYTAPAQTEIVVIAVVGSVTSLVLVTVE
ncbi:MAG: hypothetical protein WAT39_04125 [Planctomycetota bacterium]